MDRSKKEDTSQDTSPSSALGAQQQPFQNEIIIGSFMPAPAVKQETRITTEHFLTVLNYAIQLCNAGHDDQALDILNQTLKAISQLDLKNSKLHAFMLTTQGNVFYNKGDLDNAERSLIQAAIILKTLPATNDYLKIPSNGAQYKFDFTESISPYELLHTRTLLLDVYRRQGNSGQANTIAKQLEQELEPYYRGQPALSKIYSLALSAQADFELNVNEKGDSAFDLNLRSLNAIKSHTPALDYLIVRQGLHTARVAVELGKIRTATKLLHSMSRLVEEDSVQALDLTWITGALYCVALQKFWQLVKSSGDSKALKFARNKLNCLIREKPTNKSKSDHKLAESCAFRLAKSAMSRLRYAEKCALNNIQHPDYLKRLPAIYEMLIDLYVTVDLDDQAEIYRSRLHELTELQTDTD